MYSGGLRQGGGSYEALSLTGTDRRGASITKLVVCRQFESEQQRSSGNTQRNFSNATEVHAHANGFSRIMRQYPGGLLGMSVSGFTEI